jgi:hypothetical protein
MFMIVSTIWIWVNWIIAWRRGYFSVFVWGIKTWAFRVLVFVFSLWLILMLVFIGALLVLHSFLIATKQTTGEFIRSRRRNSETLSTTGNSSVSSLVQLTNNLPEEADYKEIEEIVVGTRELDRLQEVSPLTSPPIIEHTTAVDTNSFLHRAANISADVIAWFWTIQYRVLSSVLLLNNSNSTNSRSYCSKIAADELPRELENSHSEMEEEKNQETYLSRIENNSASTVSSLSFKSASYQSLSTQSKLCNMRNSVTRCFICDPKKKGLSANEKERLLDCDLRKPCPTCKSTNESKNEWPAVAKAESNFALLYPTRLLPMWQYPNSEDEDLQRQLIDQILSILRRFQSESPSHENQSPNYRNH